MYAVLTRAALRSPSRSPLLPRSTRLLSSPPVTPKSPPPSPPQLNLDFQPPVPHVEAGREEDAQGQHRTGAKSSKNSLSSIERRRRYVGRIALGVLALAFGVQVAIMGREWEEGELKAKKMVCMALYQTHTYSFSLSFFYYNRKSRTHHQQDGLVPPPALPIYSTYVLSFSPKLN
jgi:import inner membrane translocase subunit TIM50